MTLYSQSIPASSLSQEISSPLSNREAPNQANAASKASTTTRSRRANSANICRIHWLSLTLSALPSEIAQILSELNIDSQPYGSPMRNHEAQYHRLQTFEHGIRLLQTLPEERRQEIRLELSGSLFDNLQPSKQRQLLRRLDAYVASCSRIDLAIDSTNSITIDQLADKVADERRRRRKGREYQSLSTRCQSFNDLDSASGRTLYVGSKDAEHLLRCYSPQPATLRLESQSRGDYAMRRYLALQDAIGATTDDQSYLASIYTLAASATISLMEWKTPGSAGQRTDRRPRAPWYRKIVSSTKRIKLPPLPQIVIDRRDAKRLDSITRREYRLNIDRLIEAAYQGSARALIAVCRPCPSTLSSSQRRMIAQLLEAQGLTREQVLAYAA